MIKDAVWLLPQVIGLAMGLIFLFAPKFLMRLWGKVTLFMYKNFLNLSDEDFDRLPGLYDSRTVRRAIVEPESFEFRILFFRVIGVLFLLVELFVFVVLLLAIRAGELF